MNASTMSASMQAAPTEQGEAGAPETDETAQNEVVLTEFNSRFKMRREIPLP